MSSRFLPTFLALSPLCATAAAADAASATGSSVLQLILGFIAILGLLFATLWALKKLSLPRGGASSMVRVVSAAAVGPRERVVLVDVGEKRLVLGVSPGNVALLDTQPIPETSPHDPTPVADKPMFAQWLTQTLAKRNEKK